VHLSIPIRLLTKSSGEGRSVAAATQQNSAPSYAIPINARRDTTPVQSIYLESPVGEPMGHKRPSHLTCWPPITSQQRAAVSTSRLSAHPRGRGAGAPVHDGIAVRPSRRYYPASPANFIIAFCLEGWYWSGGGVSSPLLPPNVADRDIISNAKSANFNIS